MYVNADALLADLLRQSPSGSRLFQLRDDPRITRVGQFLRRYSLDELPSLFAVLVGDLSLTGPRPLTFREYTVDPELAQARLRVKPGVTGLWAVVGRPDLTWEDRVKLDLYYVENWSLLDDLVILLWTVKSAVSAT
jgi:lipopolysaccharide/colanic/teichoic acid biosynthesis glycosyltransferase